MPHTSELSPVYFFASDEILLLNEAVDNIRHLAKKQGFLDRKTFDENTDIYSRSLFAEKEILECSVSGKVSSGFQRQLEDYVQKPPADKLLIITTPKKPPAFLEKLKAKTSFTQLWPIPPKQFPAWLNKRLQTAGFSVAPELLQLLSDTTENNLLAANQTVEKLKLLYKPGKLDEAQILSVVTSSSRYTVFDLANMIKEKNYGKIKIIFDSLRSDFVEPPILLWALARECRLQKQFSLLPRLSHIDDIIKGIKKGLLWNELEAVCFLIAGRKIL
ncbi:MAG TPA: DNA polymerase III subunit delta [Gammaproteobacteria bacterium]|nr:DNA polymerase III subunit delta [Gammaproteobacteria bacterium]